MKIISFNSYKGGACRTTTCYNTLPYLAKALNATSKEPILVYDIDLDSMGLTSIFHAGQPSDGKRMVYSAKNLFVEDDEGINQMARREIDNVETGEKYFKYYEKVGNALGLEDNGSVLFLGADKNGSTITDKDYKTHSESTPIEQLIRTMEEMEPTPKAIVFDCAAGVQMTTLVALQLTNCAVVCMRPTFQFRVGTSDYIINKIPDEIKKNETNQKREIVLLPTAVAQINVPESDPNRDFAMKELNARRNKAFDAINRDIVHAYKMELKRGNVSFTLNTAMVEDRDDPVQGLPEIERFKWEEELLYTLKDEELTEQEKVLKNKFEKLAQLLAK